MHLIKQIPIDIIVDDNNYLKCHKWCDFFNADREYCGLFNDSISQEWWRCDDCLKIFEIEENKI